MVIDQSNTGDLWPFSTNYLSQDVDQSTRGQGDSRYSNSNFTILEAIIEMERPYVDYINKEVLAPMGLDVIAPENGVPPDNFSVLQDPEDTRTLGYVNGSDACSGGDLDYMTMPAAAGWISSALTFSKLMIGFRDHSVLMEDMTESTLQGELGFYTYNGRFGQYFHHNGGFGAKDSRGGIATGWVRLGHGYDCILLVNSTSPNGGADSWDTVGLIIKAFETIVVLPQNEK